MSVSALPRRTVAALSLAVLLLSSVSMAAAVTLRGGAPCESMTAPVAASPPGHSCAPTTPPARVSGCSSARCCVLTPEGAEPEARVLAAPPSGVAIDAEPSSASSVVATSAAPTSRPSETARSSSGRQRLALHSVLLI